MKHWPMLGWVLYSLFALLWCNFNISLPVSKYFPRDKNGMEGDDFLTSVQILVGEKLKWSSQRLNSG